MKEHRKVRIENRQDEATFETSENRQNSIIFWRQ